MADQQPPQRPASIRSVASNSSIASGVSLTRRARTRTRSKTVTGGPSSRLDSVPKSPASEIPYLGTKFTQEPIPYLPPTPTESQGAPPRPVRSPRRDTHSLAQAQVGDNVGIALSQDTSLAVEEPQTHHGIAKFTSQTSGMQILPTVYQPEPPPSAFSRDPDLTGFDPSSVNVRDSVSTQLSTLSSSVYPPSVSTTSGPDSPSSPRSMIQQQENYEVSSYDPEAGETQMYDGDDVSYRLRLLVNNNYFLPPAHSKPSAADFAALEKAIQKKPSTPTLFDRLRGRSKSKPTTPTGSSPGFDPAGPALRTAADSITTAHLLRPQAPRTSSQIPRGPTPETRTGRVVVVREKMDDLAAAAKQAEQEMKSRGLRRDQDPYVVQASVTDVIDPTDAVDLPPPSSNYPFAVQASALHGLGVQDSVGAALLADRLPPPQSPGMSSADPDDHWRKTLLHQAVHHSLDTTPDTSFSMMQGSSTPLASRGPSRMPEPVTLLEQRIINNRFSDNSPPTILRKKSNQSLASASSRSKSKRPSSRKTNDASLLPQFEPLRSTTPSSPLTPLAPAPRRFAFNLPHSTSHSEMEHRAEHVSTEDLSFAALRRTMSSPILSDGYDSDARHLALTPPPLPTPNQSADSFSEMQESQSRVTSRSFLTDHDHEMFDDYGIPRRSFAMSAIEGRPSLSEYSQPSPTMSAFRDAPPDTENDTAVQTHWRPSMDEFPSTSESPVSRYSAMSPPPRISSSLAHFALSPPPRSSSLNHQLRTASSARVPENSRRAHQPSTPLTDDTTLVIIAPEPTTPPFPLSQRRGNSTRIQLSLDIPPTNIPVEIHSAPPPSSPTSFFDTIQTQPNAMDDLESSSDESDDDMLDATQLKPPSPIRLDPRSRSLSITPVSSRPPLMRLGNHSTPYVSQARGEAQHPSTAIKNKQPVGNIPMRAPFFTQLAAKSEQGHPVSSFDFYKYSQQSSITPHRSNTASKRRSTVDNVAAWRTMNPQAQESLKKLDGLLIQHMETEKDTIKRIATTARSTIPLERGY
ncbi:hypothetical protein DXG01_004273 [Tephrocybe rancida]|nr:hypothetical protein DXG01_004273 [Tephrocybe rancida]